MPDPPTGEATSGPRVTNVANDSNVDAQFGYVEGDAVFHKHETIYQVHNSDSPEDKFTVARNHLNGGIPRVAEDLIGQVLDTGLVSAEIAYYYALSVLSERSLNQLGGPELDKLIRALLVAKDLPNDQWQEALNVVRRLLYCVMPDGVKEAPKGMLQTVVEDLERISYPRRTEIIRHLDMIFDGATQDELDRLNAETVASERRAGDRSGRAWIFFHPQPQEPSRAAPLPLDNGQAKSTAWLGVGLGTGMFIGLIVLASKVAGRWDVAILPPTVFLLVALLAGWRGSIMQALFIRRAMKRLEEKLYPEPPDDDEDDSETKPTELEKFIASVRRQIEYYFMYRRRPFVDKKFVDKEKWRDKTAQLRTILLARLVREYGTSRVPVPRLNWLIRWHATQAADQWKRTGQLPDYQETLRPDASVITFFVVALTAVAGSATWLLVVASGLGLPMTLIGIAEVAAGCAAVVGATYLAADHRALAAEQRELDHIADAEQQEYARWRQRLRQGPTDAEIGNWLDNDKAYLKTYAMSRCGLTNQDIVAHVVLAAGMDGARRARVRRGPPRYSAYKMLVFLLTYNGVRQVEVELDFVTGAIYDEQRKSFRYDALASTTVLEEGFQSANGRRHLVLMGNDWHITDKEALVIRRTFTVGLVDGAGVRVEVDNYEGLLDDTSGEDKAHLDYITRDTSGVAGALQILEAVAAEGREWIAKERERRNRHWQEWGEWKTNALSDPLVITNCAWPLSIGSSHSRQADTTSSTVQDD